MRSPKAEIEDRKKETLQAFNTKLEQQKPVLLSMVDSIWEALQEGVAFEQESMNFWVESAKRTQQELMDAHEAGLLQIPFQTATSPASHKKQDLWKIYDSYTHMVNNRLGILNRDEGYLAYLIKECLKVLMHEEPTSPIQKN